jgi:hypothetical protein
MEMSDLNDEIQKAKLELEAARDHWRKVNNETSRSDGWWDRKCRDSDNAWDKLYQCSKRLRRLLDARDGVSESDYYIDGALLLLMQKKGWHDDETMRLAVDNRRSELGLRPLTKLALLPDQYREAAPPTTTEGDPR